jgi:hypothetical protein
MLMERIMGVFRLSVPTFEAIEHDRNATSQALIVVLIASIANAIGNGLTAQTTGGNLLGTLLTGLIWTLVGWLLWSLITYVVGKFLFQGQATPDEMLRVIGFAFAPQVLAIIPCIGGLIGGLWSLIAGFIAVRQGLDLDDIRSLLTVLIGFAVYIPGHFLLSLFVNTILRLFGA